MSLRLRLVLILAPLFVLGLVAADVATYTSLRSSLYDSVDSRLRDGEFGVEEALLHAVGGGGGRGGPGDGPGSDLSSMPQSTYAVLIPALGATVYGHPLAASASDITASPVLPATLPPGTAGQPVIETLPGSGGVNHYRVIIGPSRHWLNTTLLVAIPIDDIDSTLTRVLLLQLGFGGGVTIVVLLLTWFMVRRGLRPLERIGETARSIVASDLAQRVTPSTDKNEVGRLGLALNAMLAQLEAAFAERARNEQRLRHFISDASHELRTPLTSMQGYAELMRRNPDMEGEDLRLAMRRMEDETKRMGVLVDDLLLLARLDQGRPLERTRVDLEALVTDACADARAIDPSRTVIARVAAPLVVTGDDMRLRQVLGNIVRNALVHTPAGSPVEVDLHPDDGHAVIEVVDHGDGIPAGHVERIFERFHRADPDRSGDQGGTGLGLSIAAAVVAAHGGSIEVVDTAGGGATFRISLPLADGKPELTGDSQSNQGDV